MSYALQCAAEVLVVVPPSSTTTEKLMPLVPYNEMHRYESGCFMAYFTRFRLDCDAKAKSPLPHVCYHFQWIHLVVDLRVDLSAHGRLYAALSRVSRRDDGLILFTENKLSVKELIVITICSRKCQSAAPRLEGGGRSPGAFSCSTQTVLSSIMTSNMKGRSTELVSGGRSAEWSSL